MSLNSTRSIPKVSLLCFFVDELLQVLSALLEPLALLLNVGFHFLSVALHVFLGALLVNVQFFRWQLLPALSDNFGQTLKANLSMRNSLSFLTRRLLGTCSLSTFAFGLILVFSLLSLGLLLFLFLIIILVVIFSFLLVWDSRQDLLTFVLEENVVSGKRTLWFVLGLLGACLLSGLGEVWHGTALKDTSLTGLSSRNSHALSGSLTQHAKIGRGHAGTTSVGPHHRSHLAVLLPQTTSGRSLLLEHLLD
mmetsp:Transcript_55109/g.152638  ORF Transcript_55109/g.152638 Transcript_55109/m.152638 type:complete len:250 (+) Transcript_55109:100-849(+)